MVGQQQSQRHLRVALFCCLYDLGGHAVEGTVMPYHKIGYARLHDQLLHCLLKAGRTRSLASRCPMKKQVLSCSMSRRPSKIGISDIIPILIMHIKSDE